MNEHACGFACDEHEDWKAQQDARDRPGLRTVIRGAHTGCFLCADCAAVLDVARDRPGLDVERLVGALAAVDARIVTEFPEEAAEMESDEAALGRRSYAEAVAAEYAALATAQQREGAGS